MCICMYASTNICVCVHVQIFSEGISQAPLWAVVEGPCELLVSPLQVVIKDLAAATPNDRRSDTYMKSSSTQ